MDGLKEVALVFFVFAVPLGLIFAGTVLGRLYYNGPGKQAMTSMKVKFYREEARNLSKHL